MKRVMHIPFIVAVLVILTFCAVLEAAEKTITSPAIGAQFVLIPAGTFTMGDVTQHQVVISKPFYMQTTEVTQGQWQKIMGNNPSIFKNCGSDCPVENVSWIDVQEFIRRLNHAEKTNTYRLPTEAEWEYACRAGTTTKHSFGDNEEELGAYAFYGKNSESKTHQTAKKKSNAWGLYDMYGNVWEWCTDWHDDYPARVVKDPKGPPIGQHKVFRGGSWLDNSSIASCAFRGQDYHVIRSSDIGFRLVKAF